MALATVLFDSASPQKQILWHCVCVSSSDMIVVFFFVFALVVFVRCIVSALRFAARCRIFFFFVFVWGCWLIILSLRCLRSCVVVVVFAIVAIVFGSSSLPNRRCFSFLFQSHFWVFFFLQCICGCARARACVCDYVFVCVCVCVSCAGLFCGFCQI